MESTLSLEQGLKPTLMVTAPASKPDAWLDRCWSPSADARCLEIGEHTVLFCERSQKLFELNSSAATLWRSLAEGVPPREIIQSWEAWGIHSDLAASYLATSVAQWKQAGMLIPTEVLTRIAEAADQEIDLQIDDCSFRIRFHRLPHAMRREITRVFKPFCVEDAGPASLIDVVADEDSHLLFLERRCLGAISAEAVVPKLKALLTDRIVQSTQCGSCLLHAALLYKNGKGLLLSGDPGAGKSTLALALLAQGFIYGSDDIVKLAADGHLSGIGLSPSSKSGAWDLVSTFAPEISSLPQHRREDGQAVRYLSVPDPAKQASAPLNWMLILDRREGASAALEPVDQLDALRILLAGAFAHDHQLRADTLEALVKHFGALNCRRLIYSSLADAVAVIEDAIGA